MFVIKRNGSSEPMRFDKISDRIIEVCRDLKVDPALITQKVVSGLKTNMKTSEIDDYVAETAYCMSTYNPDYDILSGRIFVSNLHKQTCGSVLQTMKKAYDNKTAEGRPCPLIDPELLKFVEKYADLIEKEIRYERDYSYTYFGLKTLSYGYLLKDSTTGHLLERPQHLYMRCALGIHYPRFIENKHEIDIENKHEDPDLALQRAFETYHAMSLGKFTHATPTLFNAGTVYPQLSSCNLLSINDDLDHIFLTVKRSAMISKFAGGLGINVSSVRCRGSTIASTNGKSDGIIPMIKQFDQMSTYVNQGGKRNGSVAIYLEPWHADVMDFLDLRLNDAGSEEFRAKRIFLALWIPDLFMKRVKENGLWSLMCPNTVPGLVDNYGDRFEEIYLEAERSGKVVRTIKAQDLMHKICTSQINCGLPYTMFKDHINRKNNHSNIGIIRGSNLCTEIVQYNDGDNIAVCNLVSISLKSFIKKSPDNFVYFDYKELMEITRIATINLNRTIDYGFLGVAEASITNKKQRAIGIGVQGFHEAMIAQKIEWDSKEAMEFHKRVAETIEYSATETSAELGAQYGSYHYFEGSPYSKGILQCDMWKVQPITDYDWDALRNKCKQGMRNSMLTAYMPTATTSQILGNTEAFECATSNIYTRKVLAGEFPVVSRQLYQDLDQLGLWTRPIVDKIIANNGSVQNIPEIPPSIKKLYRTVWEYSQKVFIDLSLARAPFVDQAQSLNIHMERPTVASLSSMLMYSWERGSKNGNYYIRSKPARNAVKFTVQTEHTQQTERTEHTERKESSPKASFVCTDEVCISCQS